MVGVQRLESGGIPASISAGVTVGRLTTVQRLEMECLLLPGRRGKNQAESGKYMDGSGGGWGNLTVTNKET